MEGTVNEPTRPAAASPMPEFLTGGGEMGALIRAHDWSSSAIGSPERWPLSLRVSVQLVLNSNHPMYLFWGDECICLYNDAYSASIGPEMHPQSLGQPARTVWAETWHVIGPQIEQVMNGGAATWHENHLIPITRNGGQEDVYWTYSFSPIGEASAANGVGGVLVVCTETTQRVIAANHLLARQRAEDQRRETDEINRRLVEGIRGYSIFTTDAAGIVVDWTAGAEEIFGWAGTDIVGQDSAILFTPEDRANEVPQAELTTAREKGCAEDARWHIRHDGSLFFANGSVRPLHDAAGEISGFVKMARDETARRQAEANLRESETRLRLSEESLRLSADAADIGTWDLDLLTNTLNWSDRTKAMFGISPDVPCSMDDFYGGLHPDDLAATSDAFAAALDPAQRTTYDVEYRTIGKEDRLVRWVAAKGKGLFDDNGNCIRAIGVAIDITQRKRDQDALIASDARFRFLDILASAMQLESDPEAVMAISTRLLGEHLEVDICPYADVEADNNTFHIRRDWTSPGTPSIVGTYSLDDFGKVAAEAQRGGVPLITRNAIADLGEDEASTFTAVGISATICVPLVKQGRLVAMMAVHSASPRNWSDEDVALVAEVAERCWAHIERVGAQAVVLESESRLRDVLDNMGEAFVLLDRDFRIVHMNAEGVRMEARPIESVLGKTHWEAHPDAAPEIGELYQKAMAQRRAVSLEHRYVWPDQRTSWISMRAFPVGDELAIFYSDITDQKKARAALDESEERFRLIADSAPVPMWVSQLDRKRSFVNAAYLKFLGLPYDEAIDFDWRKILHPDDHDRVAAGSIAGEASLKPFVLEGRYRRGDGEWRWLQSNSQPRFDADGRHSGFIGVAHDITEARRAEAVLRESEQRFREQFENANDFIFTTDLEMRITSCNPAVARALEREADDLIGRRISEFTPPETWEWNKAMLAAKLAGKGDASRYEVEVFARNGRRMTWEINSRLIRGDGGHPIGLHAIARDVTERKQSEDALTARSNRLNLLARIAGELVLDKAPEERLEAVYTGIAQEIGAEYYFNFLVDPDQPAQLLLSASLGLTDQQHDDLAVIQFGEHLCGTVAQKREAVILSNVDQSTNAACRGIQSLGCLSYAGFPLIAEGRLIGTIAFSSVSRSSFSEEEVALIRTVADQIAAALDRSRIMAELNKARETAEADAAEQAAILSQLAEGVIITDAVGRITFVNDAASKLHGVAALDVEPSQYSETYRLFREDGSPYPSDELPLTRAIVRGEIARDERWQIHRPDGSEVLAIGNAQPIRGPDGKAIGAVLTVRDDTARHSAERALRELNETLELRVFERTAELEYAQEALRQSQKLEAMGQLTGGVAHDFNNLLTPILGSLDLLHRRKLGGPREQMLIEGALQSADRAKTLVQRLLAFARRQPLTPMAVDIGKLVSGLDNLLASTLGPHINLRIDVDPDLPPAKGDANQLEMALLNLSVNARDAMPDVGTLVISVRLDDVASGQRPDLTPGTYVLLTVADNGAGMDRETLARSIEPFFSTKGIGKGTGLGLSMVHGLASQLGGSMTVNSEPGEGTTVEIWLPVTQSETRPAERPSQIAEPRRFSGRVLLVDDEAVVRSSTADMLTDLGFDVIEAGSAEEAIEKFDETPDICLSVTDHLMPGMTGARLADILRQRKPHIPVLIVTGYAEADGIPAHLPRLNKPFRQSELSAILNELVGGQSLSLAK